MSCEHCWGLAGSAPYYSEVLARAEKEGWPCTKNDTEGAKFRAGQYWNEETQADSREAKP